MTRSPYTPQLTKASHNGVAPTCAEANPGPVSASPFEERPNPGLQGGRHMTQHFLVNSRREPHAQTLGVSSALSSVAPASAGTNLSSRDAADTTIPQSD